jgi:hypothetical protein
MHRIVTERISVAATDDTLPSQPVQVEPSTNSTLQANQFPSTDSISERSHTSSNKSIASSSSGSSGPSRPPKKRRPLHTNMEHLSIQPDSVAPLSPPGRQAAPLLSSLAQAVARSPPSPTVSEDSFQHLEETDDDILYPIPPSNADLDMQYTDPSVPDGGENG